MLSRLRLGSNGQLAENILHWGAAGKEKGVARSVASLGKGRAIPGETHLALNPFPARCMRNYHLSVDWCGRWAGGRLVGRDTARYQPAVDAAENHAVDHVQDQQQHWIQQCETVAEGACGT